MTSEPTEPPPSSTPGASHTVANADLAGASFAQLSRDGVLATLRGTDAAGRTMLIATAASTAHAAEAVHYLNNEYALRERLSPAWARPPQGIAWRHGAMALLYPDHGDVPATQIDVAGDVDAFLVLALQICGAVRAMHDAGLLHRNLKPANILIDPAGGCRLGGFGLASLSGVTRPAAAPGLGAGAGAAAEVGPEPEAPGTVRGTPAYMAPEQTGRTRLAVDARSDLYALGVTLYELLTGRLPFAVAHPASAGEWIHAHLASEPAPPQLADGSAVPPVLSQVLLKLLAKDPQDRYQGAAALATDLQRCLQDWRRDGAIAPFALGLAGAPAVRFPARLHARGQAATDLLAAYGRVFDGGSAALVLVHGPSGVGKSALVAQFLRDPQLRAASVAIAKVDQFGGAAPYVALIEALRSLLLGILGHSGAEAGFWRQRLRQVQERDPTALAPVLDLVLESAPELAAGLAQLAGADVAPDTSGPAAVAPESAGRLALAVQRLVELFAAPERPLVMVIDDVQWLDAATLALLETLIARTRELPFLLVLTSRSEDCAPASSLSGSANGAIAAPPDIAARLRALAGHVVDIALSPLAPAAIEAMLAEALATPAAQVGALAAQVHHKTAGNPYFVRQFVQTIVDEGLAQRDAASGAWHFDLAAIGTLRSTDNVADLALARLARLPPATRQVLGALSCLGRVQGADLLGALAGASEEALAALLAPAMTADVVVAASSGYLFTHDRLQEAAYADLDRATREQLHAQLGRLMVERALAINRDDLLFGALDHLARALGLLQREERPHLARAALLAGRKARRACAYESALSYLALAHTLGGDGDERLRFDADLERAHCHCFGGHLDAAQAMLPVLLAGPSERRLQGQVLRLAAEIAVRRGDYAEAVRLSLDGLRPFGIDMPEHPTDAECDRVYAALRARLHGDWRATLHALPQLDLAADHGAVSDIGVQLALLSGMLMPTSFSSPRLLFLHLCHTLDVSLDHGMCGETAIALAWLGVMVAERHGDYAEGHAYAAAARGLVERHGYRYHAAPVLLALDQVSVWTQPLSYALGCAQAGLEAALAVGDLTMASLEHCHRICMLVTRGDPLDAVAADIAAARAFVGRLEFRDMDKILLVQQHFVNHLRGVPDAPLLQGVVDEGTMPTLRFWHWVYQAGPAFLAGDNALALACLRAADALAWSAPAHIHLLEYHLFSVLALCADTAHDHEARIAAHVAKLAAWAQANPATFADKYLLAQAALRQRADDSFGALALYDSAIAHAQAQGFNHYVAFAHELAAALCRRHGHATGAQAHVRGAAAAYRRYGAPGRGAALETRWGTGPQAGADSSHPHPGHDTVALVATADIRDIDSVIRAARALSEEIETAPLVRVLMTIALEHASAQRGLLLRMDGETPVLQASAVLTGQGVQVELAAQSGEATELQPGLPLTVLHTAMRTLKPARDAEPGAICIPLVRQSRLVGMLYLENRLATAAFSGEQERVLLLLAAQAAVSLETAALYAELLAENQQRREAEQALRESRATMLQGEQINRSGSWTWDLSKSTINGTPELARIFGLSDAQPTMPLSIFVEALHPDDQPRVQRILDHAIANRRAYGMDYRVVDPDGTVRYLSCVGEPLAGTGGDVFVGTTVDITSRRAAEDSLRQAQAELARVARVTTVGQLTSSIAHEINQPLMSISSNAGASLRWLDRNPPQLDRVRSGLQEIAAQSQRAGGIIRGLRALTRKGTQEKAPFDLHDTIRHIVSISRSELERQEVALELALHARSGWVVGDAVQLQQVLLNVVVNAIDAMAAVPRQVRSLAISTVSEDGQLAVRVDDTGSGIDAASAAQMFEPYYTTKDDGMGMGLAICRSIIEAHGGSIAATARQPHGCSIVFRLPEQA
ncbi:PAS domain S-box-containing protein [Duganella sp. 3397]|uniref:AAA family ATPase n=1 Tax=Duganella sp. 3397 TaxID=2817732 RepID=UPI00285D31AA|nr:AAA family ATPase [Duganella sp. 3397]MDR7049432.1 PAS domain S-box-containing protein [Duganella sp. 3397]